LHKQCCVTHHKRLHARAVLAAVCAIGDHAHFFASKDSDNSNRDRTLTAYNHFCLMIRSSAAVAAAVQQLGPRAAHDTSSTVSTAVTATTSTTTAAAGTDGIAATALSKRKRKPSAKALAAAAADVAAATAAEQQVQTVHSALQRAQEQLARATVYNTSTSDSGSSSSSATQGEVSLQEYSSAAAETQALVDRVLELIQPTSSGTEAVLPGT
jgi:hypothetical protein